MAGFAENSPAIAADYPVAPIKAVPDLRVAAMAAAIAHDHVGIGIDGDKFGVGAVIAGILSGGHIEKPCF